MIRATPERTRALKIVLLVLLAIAVAPLTAALLIARAGGHR